MKRVPVRQYPEKNLDRNLGTGVALADLARLGSTTTPAPCPRQMKNDCGVPSLQRRLLEHRPRIPRKPR